MASEDDLYKNFLNNILFSSFNTKEINYIIKVDKSEEENEENMLKVTILDKGNFNQNTFKMKKESEDNMQNKLKNILIESINRKLISKNSIATFIFNKSLCDEYPLGLIVIEVSRVLYRIARFNLTEYLENNIVLEKIIDIAEEIRKEGREGKMIGTLFVIGDYEELKHYLRPLILNPFYGYPENLRDLVNSDLSDTIKEYAQLDGAFIINNKGIVISAGTYIDINTENVKKYYGWGTKHLAACAITENTKSIAVLVSESGNVIKIFKGGKLILKY